MKKPKLNMPAPPPRFLSSRKNAKTPVLTGNTGPQNPKGTPEVLPAARPDHVTRFRPGVSGNPKGRPPIFRAEGAPNQSTLEARAALAANARKLTDHAIQMALKGSPTALRLCFERILPAMQDRPVQLNLPARTTTAQDLLATHNALLDAVANGTLTPLEAEAVSKLLEARRRSWESVELEDRIIQLQDAANAARKIGTPPAKIKWVQDQVEEPEMPSQAEQDRLDALAEDTLDTDEEDHDEQDNDEEDSDQEANDPAEEDEERAAQDFDVNIDNDERPR